jgi:hypothetical protein
MGGTDTIRMLTGLPKLKFVCFTCSAEEHRYLQVQAQNIPTLPAFPAKNKSPSSSKSTATLKIT